MYLSETVSFIASKAFNHTAMMDQMSADLNSQICQHTELNNKENEHAILVL